MDIDMARETLRIYYQVRRSKLEQLPCSLTVDEWITTLRQFDGLCAYCMERSFATLDHIVPHSAGGGTTNGNCVPACKPCNSRKHALHIDSFPKESPLEEKVAVIRTILQNRDYSFLETEEVKHRARPVPPQRDTTTIRFNDEDREALEIIKGQYGVNTDMAAIRLALRRFASP